ncbi:hypothetical protein [Streptomyces sp. 4N124]|uniref:hypothetical protein n=1 Tax=Streptomyces sp. 4N124 TaxID=3457420 RepID=UPI003FD4D9F4
MRIREVFAATALAVTTVLGAAGTATADDEDLLAVHQEKLAEVNIICNLPIVVVDPSDGPHCGDEDGDEDEGAAVTVQ